MPDPSDPKEQEPNTPQSNSENKEPERPHWLDYARSQGFDLGGSRDDKTPPPVLTLEDILAGLFGRAVLAIILFVAFLAGCWVAGTALHDPDTCWLLALGREIVGNGMRIPTVDPFSYTFAAQEAAGKHFILYQWLTELVFYLTHMAGGLLSLILLCAVIVVTAFLSLPLGIAVRRQSPFLLSCIVVLTGMMAASFHTLARPEIFSYLFLAVFLQLLHHCRAAALTEEGKLFPIVFVIAPVMVLWANMHTGFISGLAIVAACLLGAGIAKLVARAPVTPLIIVLAQALLGALIATLITPYGIGLWQYIPSLFYSGINKYIIELAPLGASSLSQPVYFPFFALILSWAITLLLAIRWTILNKTAEERGKIICELTISLLVGSIAIAYGFHASRLISFVSVMIVCEILALLGLKHLLAGGLEISAKEAAPGWLSLLRKLDLHALDLWKTGGSGELAIVSFCAVAGVFLIAHRVVRPELPTSTIAFHRPDAAIAYIETHAKEQQAKPPLLTGLLFNDPQFGDVLIWRHPGAPKVFIDTRFDMYGAPHVSAFMKITDNHCDSIAELDERNIGWVFIKADAPLVKVLESAPAKWTKVFADQCSVIFARRITRQIK